LKNYIKQNVVKPNVEIIKTRQITFKKWF
jgi:hypothetical protein